MWSAWIQLRYPRFQDENLEKNKVLYQRVATLAAKYKCTPGQLALSWVIHQGNDVVPIPGYQSSLHFFHVLSRECIHHVAECDLCVFAGTTKISNLDENIRAAFVKHTPEELQEAAAAVPEHEIAGGRYSEDLIKHTWKSVTTPPLDSYVAPH